MKIIENGKVNESLNFKPTSEKNINNILKNNKSFVFVLVHWCPYCIEFQNLLSTFLKDIKKILKQNIIVLDGDKLKSDVYPTLKNYSGFPGLLHVVNGYIKYKFEEERTITSLMKLFKDLKIIKTIVGGKTKKRKYSIKHNRIRYNYYETKRRKNKKKLFN